MYAIIHESGGQRKVQVGEVITIDLLNEGLGKAGDKVNFDQVLVVGEIGGGAKIGAPLVKGASVKAEIVEPMVLGEKLVVQKFRTKKAFKKKTGHRQRYTTVKVTAINA
jgi:large subunit ribosomal protein L21